ncbi:MAG: hypothetical protein K2X09_03735 [Rickettsiales bacterium]|nr:hypothetical protein [Rickettsiales bacterium]
MGYKIYGEDEQKRSRIGQFFENFFAAFMAFPICIGGWLVHLGLPVAWMFALTLLVAAVFGWKLSKPV